MKIGQKVACTDDQFEPWVFDLYKSLPKKDVVYTIREIRVGRSSPTFRVDDDTCDLKLVGARFDYLLLLEELVNPNDPHSTIEQELGFRSSRFAPLLEDGQEDEAVVLIGAGAGKKLVPAGGEDDERGW
jgi:hypothetical protein